MVEALLVFDADTTIKNKAGLNPWEFGMQLWRSDEGTKEALKDALFALREVGAGGTKIRGVTGPPIPPLVPAPGPD